MILRKNGVYKTLKSTDIVENHWSEQRLWNSGLWTLSISSNNVIYWKWFGLFSVQLSISPNKMCSVCQALTVAVKHWNLVEWESLNENIYDFFLIFKCSKKTGLLGSHNVIRSIFSCGWEKKQIKIWANSVF